MVVLSYIRHVCGGAKFDELMLFLILDTSYVTDPVNHAYTFSDCEIVN